MSDVPTDFDAYIGADTGPFRAWDAVNAPMIRHWCEALEDSCPIYTDPDAARAQGFAGIVAPPTMLQAWTMNGYAGRRAPGSDASDPMAVLPVLEAAARPCLGALLPGDVDDQPLDDRRHPVEGEVERQAGVGDGHPLRRGVADVPLVPQGHVLQAHCGIAAQQAGQAGDVLGADGVALVGHGRGAGLAALLTGWLNYHLDQWGETISQWGQEVFGVVGDTIPQRAETTIRELNRFLVSLGSPVRLADLGLTENDIGPVAAHALEQLRVRRIPGLDQRTSLTILQNSL